MRLSGISFPELSLFDNNVPLNNLLTNIENLFVCEALLKIFSDEISLRRETIGQGNPVPYFP